MIREMTLAIDCGGGGIKGSVVDERGTMMAPPRRVPTPYPLSPELLVETVVGLARELPAATRVTMGMPGMIRHGVVIATPHYITRDGPRSRVLPELVERWDHFDMGRAIEQALGLPTKVLNDAEVAGAGAITGRGLEMIITLGTGLGNAVFDGGQLAPHVEVSQGPVRWGLTYDDYIGEHERLRLDLGYDGTDFRGWGACASAMCIGRVAFAEWSMVCARCTCGTASTWGAVTRSASRPRTCVSWVTT